jgi:hypothetical protein
VSFHLPSVLPELPVVEEGEGLDGEGGREVPEDREVEEVELVADWDDALVGDFRDDGGELVLVLEQVVGYRRVGCLALLDLGVGRLEVIDELSLLILAHSDHSVEEAHHKQEWLDELRRGLENVVPGLTKVLCYSRSHVLEESFLLIVHHFRDDEVRLVELEL